jgi:hypothetical protein
MQTNVLQITGTEQEPSRVGQLEKNISAFMSGMTLKKVLIVLGTCTALLIIALITVVVYFTGKPSVNNGSGGGGGGGGGGDCPAPSTVGVTCTHTDKWSCVADCKALKLDGSGCTAVLNSQNVCEVTCPTCPKCPTPPTPRCTTDDFDVSNSSTWVTTSQDKCFGTFFSGGSQYCQDVPLSNNGVGQYINWAKVNGQYEPSHLDDGVKALAGTISDQNNTWYSMSQFCSGMDKYGPCTGLDIFYDDASQHTYYVPCMLSEVDKHVGTALQDKAVVSNTQPFFNDTAKPRHLGPFITVTQLGAPSENRSTNIQSAKVPGW